MALWKLSSWCVLAAAPILCIGCRQGVEGWWTGNVGDEPAQLRLEQTGSLIEGEVCTASECVPILQGESAERTITLYYGCAGCTFPETTLELVLAGGRLAGEADLVSCECPDDQPCDCREQASFIRCPGACGGAP